MLLFCKKGGFTMCSQWLQVVSGGIPKRVPFLTATTAEDSETVVQTPAQCSLFLPEETAVLFFLQQCTSFFAPTGHRAFKMGHNLTWVGFSVKNVYLDAFRAWALPDFVYTSLHWTPRGRCLVFIGLYGRGRRVECRSNC